MATVDKAFDTRLEREVAVKVFLPSRQQTPKFLKRFEREAKGLTSKGSREQDPNKLRPRVSSLPEPALSPSA